MATQLRSITNVTTQNALFTNQENTSDTTPVNTFTIAHTGGKDGDYSNIPDCSDASYYDKHHMTVAATDAGGNIIWSVTFWNDDAQDHQLYYSLDGTYTNRQLIENSASWKGVNMMIDPSASPVHPQFFPY
jgi:hypothetical protein